MHIVLVMVHAYVFYRKVMCLQLPKFSTPRVILHKDTDRRIANCLGAV